MKKLLLPWIFFPLMGLVGAQTSLPLNQGVQAFEAGDYPSALVNFQKILGDPLLKDLVPAATFWMGKTYFTLGDMGNAERYVEFFLKTYGGNSLEPEALYTKGRILLVQGEYEKSIVIFNEFLQRFGENSFTPNTLFWIAENTYQLGRFEDAGKLYEKLVKLYPSSPKTEAAQFKISLIDMKRREDELLTLLKWSHQESVNAFDEFQRKEKAFQMTLQEYEKKLQDLQSKDSQVAKIAALEAQLKAFQTGTVPDAASTAEGIYLSRLLLLKKQALELKSYYIDWEKSHGK